VKLLINDLKQENIKALPCTGCFGCWIKTPGQCILKDHLQHMGEYINKCDEIIIISRCCYGGYSPFVKNALDRSIGALLPFFKIVDGKMHHSPRVKNQPGLHIYFYGDLTEEERHTAESLAAANAVNLNARNWKALFFDSPDDIPENISGFPLDNGGIAWIS
jgi:multimeric flavodoxin WrbA